MAAAAARAAQTTQRLLQEAVAALVAADRADPTSMLKPLRLLARLHFGGQALMVSRAAPGCSWGPAQMSVSAARTAPLARAAAAPDRPSCVLWPCSHSLCLRQGVVKGWAGLEAAVQQDAFDTAVLVAGRVAAGTASWQALEEELDLALP